MAAVWTIVCAWILWNARNCFDSQEVSHFEKFPDYFRAEDSYMLIFSYGQSTTFWPQEMTAYIHWCVHTSPGWSARSTMSLVTLIIVYGVDCEFSSDAMATFYSLWTGRCCDFSINGQIPKFHVWLQSQPDNIYSPHQSYCRLVTYWQQEVSLKWQSSLDLHTFSYYVLTFTYLNPMCNLWALTGRQRK